jgi:hypothetical protein
MRNVLTIFAVALFAHFTSEAQSTTSFCKALEQKRMKQVERMFRQKVRILKKGIPFDNGPGSGRQVSFAKSIDSITHWLQQQPCVLDAQSDQCEIKISIYPNWFVIGMKISDRSEYCFYIQQGTTGKIDLFGWKPRLLHMKNHLIYKRMYNCPSFMETQKKNCEPASF